MCLFYIFYVGRVYSRKTFFRYGIILRNFTFVFEFEMIQTWSIYLFHRIVLETRVSNWMKCAQRSLGCTNSELFTCEFDRKLFPTRSLDLTNVNLFFNFIKNIRTWRKIIALSIEIDSKFIVRETFPPNPI